jgi:transposase InsO family protein
MEASFCVETIEDALAHHGKPEIVNADQGAQFTGLTYTGVITKHSIAITMDGKGAWRDNVFVERFCAPSNTTRCIYGPMRASAMHVLRSAAICTSTMSDARMRALTA